MSIFRRLFGGWGTVSPGGGANPQAGGLLLGGPDASPYRDGLSDHVTADLAIRLSAVWSCVSLRAETIGSLPLHLRDGKKNLLKDHPLYDVIHRSPNAMQTAAEYWSLQSANVDMHGNSFSRIIRRASDRKLVSLEPIDDTAAVTLHESRTGWKYQLGASENDRIPADDILHLRGFSTNRYMGLPRIEIGRQILGAQLSANESAIRAFQQGLKVGGFFEMEQNLTEPQRKEWNTILERYGAPENAGKYLTLFKGMKPVAGTNFRIKPAEAELLASRHFGIEEICRLFNTPPQLIGHTDKASSWASSIEQINLFFLMYGITPSLVRKEQTIEKKLLTGYDRAKGVEAKHSIQGLLRGDMKARMAFYASALQNGIHNRDEIRDFEERGTIPGGDKYTVQLNLTDVAKIGETPEGTDNANPTPDPSV